ncbi:MAG: hypothetical protein EOP84_17795 [Verrucomicrobiaceae bacterium]|nr:MAG: hypothetical protein EOP84_17795 [Verrucomicrobiaceae bacterium]
MASREVKIYCPKCEWEPRQSSQWMCQCRHCWNTFDTGGVCPKCGKVWTETQCLACHKWSAHSDWYHEFISEDHSSREEATHPAAMPGAIVEAPMLRMF